MKEQIDLTNTNGTNFSGFEKRVQSMQGGFTTTETTDPETGKPLAITLHNVSSKLLLHALKEGHIDLEKYAQLSTVALKKQEEENKEVSKDPLTKVFNRVKLDLVLKDKLKELEESSGDSAFMIVSLDINDFKKFNEGPGRHHTGDRALQKFVSRLKTIIPEGAGDIFRRSGDEFVLVTPILDKNDVNFEDAFLSIRQGINNDLSIDVENENGEKMPMPITASMGHVVAHKSQYHNIEDLLQASDEQEGESKKEKNRRKEDK